MFLTATNNGEIKLENIIGGYIRGKPILSNNIPKNSRFVIFDALNPNNSQKALKFNDTIMLRSQSFQALVITTSDNHISCNGQIATHEAHWKLINPRTPYIPDFVFKRRFQNFNCLSYINYVESLSNKDQLNTSFNTSVNRKKNEEKSLLSLSVENQEKALCEDLILNLMGMDGNYIKRNTKVKVMDIHSNPDNYRNFSQKFEIEPHLENKTCGRIVLN